MTIYALGPQGTNGHEAARIAAERRTYLAEIEFCKTNPDIFDTVLKFGGLGVAPIENASAGLVMEVVRWWLKQPLPLGISVVGELQLPIVHQLLVHPTLAGVTEITEVISHPQALEQCRATLKLLGLEKTRPVTSTARAAELVARDPEYHTIAALASPLAGEIYGLTVLRPDVQDSKTNATRFHVIGTQRFAPTGKDRTAMLFRLPNTSRALVTVLDILGTDGRNLSSIHSIPLGSPQEYAFYAEADFHVDDSIGKKIIPQLFKQTSELRILGSYPQGIEAKNGGAQ